MTTTVNTKLVTKRDGTTQAFDSNKIQKRVDALLEDLETEYMDIPSIVSKTVAYAHSGKFFIT
jgi:transcriptional regulator NrdR family protein